VGEDGYLFEFERFDFRGEGNLAKGRLLLIATTRGDAVESARDCLPAGSQLMMIDSGAELLAHAKGLGIKMHGAKII